MSPQLLRELYPIRHCSVSVMIGPCEKFVGVDFAYCSHQDCFKAAPPQCLNSQSSWADSSWLEATLFQRDSILESLVKGFQAEWRLAFHDRFSTKIGEKEVKYASSTLPERSAGACQVIVFGFPFKPTNKVFLKADHSPFRRLTPQYKSRVLLRSPAQPSLPRFLPA